MPIVMPHERLPTLSEPDPRDAEIARLRGELGSSERAYEAVARRVQEADAEIARLRATLAEALAFLPDASNTTAAAVASWHARHTETIRVAAKHGRRLHLLSPPHPR